jgi:polyribonucleotide nucleotidyltransferase
MEFKLEIGKKTFIVNIDNLAEQANGSVFVRLGSTLVLATATMSSQDLEDLDFFPLTVEFEEKYYAAGKILGSRFIRREGRPSEEAILTARLIDRAIRPLFPENLRREVQVIVTCFSFDEENDPDIPGLLAASLALGISDIPWNGPVAPIRIGKSSKGNLLNPSYKEREGGELDIIMTGVEENSQVIINMIEAQADEIEEKTVLEVVSFAKDHLKKIIDFQKEIIAQFGKEKVSLQPSESFPEIEKNLKEQFAKRIEEMLMQAPKIEQKRGLGDLEKEISDFVSEKFGEDKVGYAKDFLSKELKEILHRNVIEKERRPDGRKLDEIRPIEARVGILPRTHGSAVFIRGKTKSLSIVTLGSPSDQRLIEGMEIRGKKRFMHHYNFPPYCSGEVKPVRGPGRREIGHGMLAEKALVPLIPNFEDFPYTIRVVSEILSSNGSTSMASISSSSLALMDAGVPIKRPAAGIAIGLIKSEKDYKLLADIQGPEDHYGDMDFKVAGTSQGITAIQMDVKIRGISQEIIKEALELAKIARHQILKITQKVLSKPRESLSPFAPKIFSIKINPEKIGGVIGPGGRTINEIIKNCEVSIDIEPDGHVFVTSQSEEAAQKAIEWIKNITREVKVGEIFQGKVKRILDFGAIVEILPEREGLVHISQLAPYRVRKVEDIIKVGDIIPVKVIAIDDSGKISLSLKDASPPQKRVKKFKH